LLNLAVSAGNAVEKKALKTGSNIITDILNTKADQHADNIIKLVSVKLKVTLKKRLKIRRVLAWL